MPRPLLCAASILACGVAALGQGSGSAPRAVESLGEYEDRFAGFDPELPNFPTWYATRAAVKCRFEEATLDEVLEGFRSATRLLIEVDSEAFPKGLPDKRVSIRLGPDSLAGALEACLEKAGLALVVQRSRLVVTTPERVETTVAFEAFDTRNILEADERFSGSDDWGALRPDLSVLWKHIAGIARPEGAKESGAARPVLTARGLLFVEDVPKGLARVREFIEEAKPAAGALSAAGEATNPASLEIRDDRRLLCGWHEASLRLVDVTFKDASLKEVLRDFRVLLDIPVVLDPSARTENVKKHRFTLESRGVTLRNTLAKILASAELELVIEAQGLRVASAAAAATIPAVEIYDVKRLLDLRYGGENEEDGPSVEQFESDAKKLLGSFGDADSLALTGEHRFIVALTPARRRKFEDWMVEELGKGSRK